MPENQPTAKSPNSEGQEQYSGPEGQTTSGSKVEGQVTSAGRVVEGQTADTPRHPSKLNR